MKKFHKAVDKAINALAFFAGILVIFLMLITTYLVGARYIFSNPPPWATEVSEYMLAAYAFLSAAWLLKKGGHVKVDIVVRQLSTRTQAILNIATSSIGAIVCLIIFISGVNTTRQYIIDNVQTQTILNFPSFILISLIPIGFFFLTMQFIFDVHGICISLKNKEYKKSETNTISGGIC